MEILPQSSAAAMTHSLPHPDSYVAYAFLEKDGDLQRITVPWRDPIEGEIIVKVLACGICATFVTFFSFSKLASTLIL